MIWYFVLAERNFDEFLSDFHWADLTESLHDACSKWLWIQMRLFYDLYGPFNNCIQVMKIMQVKKGSYK